MQFLPAPPRPGPPSEEVHVWRVPLGETSSEAALRGVLARYLDEAPEQIELSRGEHGKPALAREPERLAFNLSHSGALALVAVCRGREVGVDVERVEPQRDLVAVAERAFAPEDATAVRAAAESERVALFYDLWARHEARLKCLGLGLAARPTWPPPAVSVSTLPVDPGYAAAVAVSGGPLPIRCWRQDRPLPIDG